MPLSLPRFGSKKVKSKNEYNEDEVIALPMFSLPVKDIKNLIIHQDDRYVLVSRITPVNGDLLSDDSLSEVADSIQGALSSFEGRIGIYIQSETINIDSNLANIDKHMQTLNSEIKLVLLSKQREHLSSMVSKTRNVFNFYLALETKADNYVVAEQILYDSFNNIKTELEGQDIYADVLFENDIKELVYKRLNPEGSISEPYSPDMSIQDIVPPNAVIYEDGSRLEIENRIYKYFSITKFPTNVDKYRWLRKIFATKGDVNIAITMTPKNKGTIQKELDKAYDIYSEKANMDNTKASEYVEFENQKQSALAMITELGSDNVSFYDVNITISVSGKDKNELDAVTNSLRTKISSANCMSTEIKRKGWDPLFTTLPFLVANNITKNYVWNLSSKDIGSLIPFDSSELMETKGTVQGENIKSGGVIIVDSQNPYYNNSHMVLVADSGFGKTYFLMCDSMRNMPYVDSTIMFDVSKGDLLFPFGDRYVFGPGHNICTNPFHIRNAMLDTNEGSSESIANVSGQLSQKIMDLIVFFKWIIPDLSAYDEALLEEDIRDTYAKVNLTFDSTDLPNSFPTMSTLANIQESKNIAASSQMERERRVYLMACLKPYTTGAYASMFNGQTNYDFNEFTVLALHQCSEAVKKPLYDLLLKDVWQFCKKDGTKRPTKKRVYVDECHEFADVRNPQTLEFLSTKLSKQSRGFGVSLITATQNLPDFLSIPKHGQAIIDNSYFKLFGKLGNSDLAVAKELYDFSEAEMKILKGSTTSKKSGKGKGVFIVGAQRVLIQTRASRFELEIIDFEQYEKIYGVPSRFANGTKLIEVI